MFKFLTPWSPQLLSVLRIVAAFLLFWHGTQKMFGFPAAPAWGLSATFSLTWFAALLEIVGGALLFVGLFTRPVAFILSGLLAFAYFLGHAQRGMWPLLNGGELAALYSFVFLYIAAAGPGPWSLDAKRRDL